MPDAPTQELTYCQLVKFCYVIALNASLKPPVFFRLHEDKLRLQIQIYL